MSCRAFFPAVHVVAAALLAHSASFAAETLYYFIDEHGVPHFSNHPLDPRYRPLATKDSESAGGRRAPIAADLHVEVMAPEQAVISDLFDVTISVAQPRSATGYLELSFDPEIISLQAISVDGSLTEPGKVRIEVKLDAGQQVQTLASFSFQAVAQAPAQTSIQITQLELFDPSGQPVPAPSGAWTNVSLVQ
jgi:hypothetical protein